MAAVIGGGGDDGDGGDAAKQPAQSRGGCRDSLAVVVNTDSVGGSRRHGNRPSHTGKPQRLISGNSVSTTAVGDGNTGNAGECLGFE